MPLLRSLGSLFVCVQAFCSLPLSLFHSSAIEAQSNSSPPVYCSKTEHTHSLSCYSLEGLSYSDLDLEQDPAASPETDGSKVMVLDCSLEEHTHTLSCYSNPDADLVDPLDLEQQSQSDQDEVWERICDLAEQAVGYVESTANYQVDDDSGEVKGYSKYGAYYGIPYDDWNGAFTSFILLQAQSDLPQDPDPVSLYNTLSSQDLLQSNQDWQSGDLLFVLEDGSLQTAFAMDEQTMIQGDYENTVASRTIQNVIAYASSHTEKTDAISEQPVLYASSSYSTRAASNAEIQDSSEEQPVVLAADDSQVSEVEDGTGDLKPYITGSAVYSSQDGTWQPVTTITNGEKIRVKLDFNFPNGTISESNRTFSYQMPDSIAFESGTDEPIYNSDHEQVGTFTINSSGKMTVTFDSKYASNPTGFTGNISVEGTVNEDNEKTEPITFPGTGTSIQVSPHSAEPDIHIVKSGDYIKDGNIKFTLKVTSENGTDNTSIDLYDWLTKVEGCKLDSMSDITVTKYDANGTEVSCDGYWSWNTSNDLGPKLEIYSLPALKAGQYYIITYILHATMTQDDSEGVIENTGSVIFNDVNDRDSVTFNVPQPMVQKSGSADLIDKTITWTVSVNRQKQDISGSVFNDNLTDGMELVPGSSITVWAEDGTILQEASSFPFTIQSDLKEPFTITYKTTLGTLNSSGSVSNTATLDWAGQQYSGSTSLEIGDYGWKIKKEYDGTASSSDGLVNLEWSLSSYPDKDAQNGLEIQDTISQVQTSSDSQIPGSHYGDVSTLQQEIEDTLEVYVQTAAFTTQKVGWNNDMGLTCLLTFYDEAGQEITSGQASSFTLSLHSDSSLTIAYLQAQYETIFNSTLMNPLESGVAKNSAAFNEETSSASFSYTKPGSLSKSVQTGADPNTWSQEDMTVSYEDCGGYIRYRLEIPVDSEGFTTVSDNLSSTLSPYNMEFYVEYSKDDIQTTLDGNPVEWYCYPGWDSYEGKEYLWFYLHRTDILNITKVPVTIIVEYSVWVYDDPVWKDPMKDSQTYVNNLIYEGKTVTTNTTITRTIPDLAKTGTITQGSADSSEMEITYDVIINPSSKNLDLDNGVLTVTDVLSPVDGIDCTLDLSSIQLYTYSSDAQNHLGTLLSSSLYSYIYDKETATITLQVPDNVGLVFQYTYKIINNRSEAASLSNSVDCSGKYTTSSATPLQGVSASGQVVRFDLTLIKVQEGSYDITLQGAEFVLQQYDVTTGTWNTLATDLISDSDGKITFSGPDEEALFKTGVLYRFVEEVFPDGYTKTPETDGIWVFMFKDTTQTDSEAKALVAETVKEQDLIDKAQVLPATGGQIYAANKLSVLKAEKTWTNIKGEILTGDEIPVTSVQVELVTTPNKDGSDATVVDNTLKTLDASNDWTCTWDSLPYANADGEPLYYFVKEVTQSDQWNVFYINNTGSVNGTVSILNSLVSPVSLPELGGSGDKTILTAILCWILALCCFVIHKQIHQA